MAQELKNQNGEVIKRDEKPVFGSDSLGVVKGVSLENRTLRILATDETRDRDGDIITMNGWRLDNYIKNPVFLWAHDYASVPIGAAIKIEKKRTPHRLMLTHKFPTAGVHPFADMILQLYHEKVINAGSVGFIPFNWEEIKDDEEKGFFGPKKFTDQELLEHSGCAVPANPNALQDSVSQAMKSLNYKYDDKVKLFKVVTGADILELDDKTKERASAEIQEVIEKGAVFEEETKIQVQVPEKIEDNKSLPDTECIGEIDGVLYYRTLVDHQFEMPDPFKGLKNLINEILDRHIAESLADEKSLYRKRADVLLKLGAVLSRKNKGLLRTASDNILEVLENAEPVDQDAEDNTATQTSLEVNDDGKVNIFDVILSDEGKSKTSTAKAVVKPKIDNKKETRKKVIAKVNKSINEILQSLESL